MTQAEPLGTGATASHDPVLIDEASTVDIHQFDRLVRHARANNVVVRLTVEDDRRRARLPADYVSQHAQLGYASTIASAQGLTVDSTVLVAESSLTRKALYVAVTRARTRTQLVVETDPDQSDREVLEATLSGSNREASAMVTANRDLAHPAAPSRVVVEQRADIRRSLA